MSDHPIIWLTGHSGSGKTSVAQALQYGPCLGGLVRLDGDEMRESISFGLGFSAGHREEHNIRVARLASVLSRQHPVVVSVIAPAMSARYTIQEICQPVWVWVRRTLPEREGHWYQAPPSYHEDPEKLSGVACPFSVDHDVVSPDESAQLIEQHVAWAMAFRELGCSTAH